MSQSERRLFPRFAVNLQVTLEGGQRHELSSENISLGGLFLATPDDLCREGDQVTVHLVLPGADGEGEASVSIPSVVAHVVPPLGFGVRFQLEDEDAKAKLKAYVDRIAAVQAELA